MQNFTLKNLLTISAMLLCGLVHAQSNFTNKTIGVGVVVADMDFSGKHAHAADKRYALRTRAGSGWNICRTDRRS